MRLPGTQMLALARLIIDPAVITRVLEPLVADWQREWLGAETPLRRTVARVSGLAAFLRSSTYCVMTDPVPRSVRQGSWSMLLLFTGTGTLLLALPYSLWSMPLWTLPLLLPGTLVLSIPFAALPLAIKLGAIRTQGPAGARHLLRVTMALVVLVFVIHNWVVPVANVAFRDTTVRIWNSQRPVPRALSDLPRPGLGARELTLPQLVRPSAATRPIISSPRQLQEERHIRAALPLAPLALAIFGWSLGRVCGSARATRLAFWWAFAALTYGLTRSLGMTLERWWHLPREIAIWLPLALWFLASVALIRSARAAHLENRSQPVQ